MSILVFPRESELALAIVTLVAESAPGKTDTVTVCTQMGITRVYGAQIVYLLGKAGLLLVRRGRGGGLRLARPASQISIADVIAVSAQRRLRPERRQGTVVSAMVEEITATVNAEMDRIFASYSIWDLVEARKAPEGQGIAHLEQLCSRRDCPNVQRMKALEGELKSQSSRLSHGH